ncbi:hypothetical protein NDU88_004004, partial [Pleurodeles waltl]
CVPTGNVTNDFQQCLCASRWHHMVLQQFERATQALSNVHQQLFLGSCAPRLI